MTFFLSEVIIKLQSMSNITDRIFEAISNIIEIEFPNDDINKIYEKKNFFFIKFANTGYNNNNNTRLCLN